MRYADIKEYLTQPLADKYSTDPLGPPLIQPGPDTGGVLLLKSVDRMVFLNFGGGAGVTNEGMFIRPTVAVRCVGNQKTYEDAEDLAFFVDLQFLRIGTNTQVGSALALGFTHVGGSPTLLQRDAGGRYHFTCAYITMTPTGL